ncbi:MAG: hypothetical protein DMG60_15320 [Acidobacteria bacterium]|nr:MAG: hypothetical protein DMG60_15320 [Acidobacteriota bacterium]
MTTFSLRLIALLLSPAVFAHPQSPQTTPAMPPAPAVSPQSSQTTPATPPTPAVSPEAMQDLGTRVATRINTIRQQDPRAQHATWGISVVDLATGASLYAENADKLLQPASNTKLFTTATTLALVGADYKFSTTIEAAGPPDSSGRVSGDLILVGRGDPNLSGRILPYAKKTERVTQHARMLDELVDQVAAAGVRVIDGDIVGDDSYFVYERYGEGWAQDDLMWDYGAPVSALTVNDNVVFASLKPADRVGQRALLTLDPYTSYYTVRNLVTTTARNPCARQGSRCAFAVVAISSSAASSATRRAPGVFSFTDCSGGAPFGSAARGSGRDQQSQPEPPCRDDVASSGKTDPIAAEDGSLSTRFKGTFAADHLEAKTGQLGEVNSLSGYAITKGGHNIAFSILINHHTLGNTKAKQMIDDIVNAVLEED